MLATSLSATLVGLQAHAVRVEVKAVRGPPFFELVGLAEASVRESRVRVKSALGQVSVHIHECGIVVNLAPADLRKTGSGFDLAIAAAVLGALGTIPVSALAGILFLGELSLEGTVQPVRGVLAHLVGARTRKVPRAVVPHANAAEAALVEGLDIRTVRSLRELLDALRGTLELPKPQPMTERVAPPSSEDLADVRGQAAGRRAVEVSAAGAHNLLFIGPPGAGKTMLARRLPGILPPLSSDEALEVTAIHSVAGLLASPASLSRVRPFRAPHHTVTEVGLVGGGDAPRPGEVSLAHQGVLFLDEVAEFRRSALEALRQPLEDGVVTISRAYAKATFPARVLVAAAMNPCYCGYLGDGTSRCACSPERLRAYRSKLSGPLLDRLDVHVVLPPVALSALAGPASGEASALVRERVRAARAVQRERFTRREVGATTNASLGPRDAERVASLCKAGNRLLACAVERLALSARAYGKVLRVARTLADLDGSTAVMPVHVAEAISMRVLDRPPSAAAA